LPVVTVRTTTPLAYASGCQRRTNVSSQHLFILKTRLKTFVRGQILRRHFLVGLFLCVTLDLDAQKPPPDPRGPDTTETIIFIRHGEKPGTEIGQLSCQGLNRSLALPKLLIRNYGRANFIFAPDPAKKVSSNGMDYSYTRALATIEPTAIELGLPVETKFGYEEIDLLQEELLSPRYGKSLVFVAWEHFKLQQLVKNLFATLGSSAVIPPWNTNDFDSIYVVTISTVGSHQTITFRHDYEHLDGLSAECPDAKTN
jgi:hypothetical protein